MADKDRPKTIAILAYITIVGWIIAFVLNQDKKSRLGSFHIRQALLLHIVFFIGTATIIIPFVGWVIQVLAIVLLILGLIDAVNKKQKPVALFGNLAQDWFKGL